MASASEDEAYASEASDEYDETPAKKKPSYFRFFDLPSELRIRIYEYALVVPRTIDLDPTNYRKIAPRLEIFETCRQMHEEAYRIFYSQHTFRLFSVTGRFFNTKQQLLARLPAKYRREITSLQLRLGPGWSVSNSLYAIEALKC